MGEPTKKESSPLPATDPEVEYQTVSGDPDTFWEFVYERGSKDAGVVIDPGQQSQSPGRVGNYITGLSIDGTYVGSLVDRKAKTSAVDWSERVRLTDREVNGETTYVFETSDLSLESRSRILVLDWNPPKQPCTACWDGWTKLKRHVEEHERRHVEIAEAVVRKFAAEWQQTIPRVLKRWDEVVAEDSENLPPTESQRRRYEAYVGRDLHSRFRGLFVKYSDIMRERQETFHQTEPHPGADEKLRTLCTSAECEQSAWIRRVDEWEVVVDYERVNRTDRFTKWVNPLRRLHRGRQAAQASATFTLTRAEAADGYYTWVGGGRGTARERDSLGMSVPFLWRYGRGREQFAGDGEPGYESAVLTVADAVARDPDAAAADAGSRAGRDGPTGTVDRLLALEERIRSEVSAIVPAIKWGDELLWSITRTVQDDILRETTPDDGDETVANSWYSLGYPGVPIRVFSFLLFVPFGVDRTPVGGWLGRRTTALSDERRVIEGTHLREDAVLGRETWRWRAVPRSYSDEPWPEWTAEPTMPTSDGPALVS